MSDDTRWLDQEEQRTWRSFITASRLFWDQVERQLQQCAGIPHAYYEILVRLSEAPEHTLRMSQLASTSLSSRRASTGRGMEEAGWIAGCLSRDRRGAWPSSPRGMARLEAGAPAQSSSRRCCRPAHPGPVAHCGRSAPLAATLSTRGARAPDAPSCDDEARLRPVTARSISTTSPRAAAARVVRQGSCPLGTCSARNSW